MFSFFFCFGSRRQHHKLLLVAACTPSAQLIKLTLLRTMEKEECRKNSTAVTVTLAGFAGPAHTPLFTVTHVAFMYASRMLAFVRF